MGPIPWDKILLYSDYQSFDKELSYSFMKLIRKLDQAYLSWIKENRKTTSD